MNLSTINPLLYWVDSYKISHINFEVSGVKEVYSNFTPRFDKYMRESLGSQYDGKYVVFGIQWMLIRMNEMFNKGFFERDKDDVSEELEKGGLLTISFKDGLIYKAPTVFNIRDKMYGNG